MKSNLPHRQEDGSHGSKEECVMYRIAYKACAAGPTGSSRFLRNQLRQRREADQERARTKSQENEPKRRPREEEVKAEVEK
ncbi:hypothetical protein NDU88_004682 [Pleurodeles waltl]|uniref:Uncharacterized protein n=1 Tax=Pleurodeles waltl TaxID=8319 RepID=A0AAV7UG79_PLEWA|nr:hypothetical protein NDU88_004682 [Pleurodeles waltl]